MVNLQVAVKSVQIALPMVSWSCGGQAANILNFGSADPISSLSSLFPWKETLLHLAGNYMRPGRTQSGLTSCRSLIRHELFSFPSETEPFSCKTETNLRLGR